MHVHIIYAHPSQQSFTHEILVAFSNGLEQAGHTFSVSDLYAMGFNAELSYEEYLREHNYRVHEPVPEDVAKEQALLNAADAWAFIYPVWWTDCPAKLKGWFDRVWTVGFAHGPQEIRTADKALVLCTAGHLTEHLEETGCYQAMETTMLTDRIYTRAALKEFHVFDGQEVLEGNAYLKHRNLMIEKAHVIGKSI